MDFTLSALPYPLDALEPYISKETLEYHHGKHHQAYLSNLYNLVKDTPFENGSLEHIILNSADSIFNNAAQVWNHSFYWDSLTPSGQGQPKGILLDAILSKWETFDLFKDNFTQLALANFGSGWTWLVLTETGLLEIINTPNAQTPFTTHSTPLLTCDVWEHAYYLDHRNLRAKYLEGFWHLANWEFASTNFIAASLLITPPL
ncbi:superoxide dismutase [Sapientia aquatica]|uniref:Superoxide dismutase n=1 Tax=Sapientia aquatica TaxID=1549640 RepID=A0A4R5W344_9BURK|nr:Fe-Mn family superoxide dismutase [Sapientia aquatica]TDK67090.1 superoxide dismutase [Fe] [Sapientia aquatica]